MKKHHTVAEFLLTESFGDHHPQHGHRNPTEIAEDEIRDALPRDYDERQFVRKVILGNGSTFTRRLPVHSPPSAID